MRRTAVFALLTPTLFGACLANPADVETAVESSEVLGGTAAPVGKWPDVVAVRSGSQQFCTGTLIAPTVVLTAGHCAGDIDNVLIGTSSLARAAEGEVITVIRTIEYPNSQSTGADLAVLVLAKPSRFTPRQIASGWARADIANGAQVAL
ncbi:MAG: trypsin-like serine protease, partial [Deltaproteobacteria bacterium]|nr:trypsin-like serine protease [Deltaproteobacteria bacterium]